MTTKRTHLSRFPASPRRMSARDRKTLEQAMLGRAALDEFQSGQPVYSAIDAADGAPLPAAPAGGEEIAFQTKHGSYELHLAVVDTDSAPVYNLPYISADGLEVPLDADVKDGATAVEITNGITASAPTAFVVGSDRPFYFECQVKIDDVSDLEQVFCGFRKAEAYQADPDDYDEMAAFHIGETGGTVADGQINIATILNNAATSYTDTTEDDWADGQTKTLKVIVKKSGEVQFSLDGEQPAAVPGFRFDDGEVVVPFFFAENSTGSTIGDPGVTIVSWKCGQL